MAEAEKVGVTQDLVPENLEHDRRRSAKAAQELFNQGAALSREWAGQKGQRLLVVSSSQRVEAVRQLAERLLPADWLKLSAPAWAGSLEWMGNAIRMIDRLDRGLPPRAELAAIDGMLGVAFKFRRESHLYHA